MGDKIQPNRLGSDLSVNYDPGKGKFGVGDVVCACRGVQDVRRRLTCVLASMFGEGVFRAARKATQITQIRLLSCGDKEREGGLG